VPLRVLTLNLWHDAGPWPERRERIRHWIEKLEPDVIGFQEAVRQPHWEQVPDLLTGLGYRIEYAPASPFWKTGLEHQAGDVGNAVASRFPLRDSAVLRLPESDDGERRVALGVTLAAPWGDVAFTVTHLNWKLDHGAVREQQVQALCEFALKRAPRRGFPPILAGDFNAEPEAAEIRYVTGLQSLGGRSVCFLDAWRRTGGPGEGITWSNRNPFARTEREPDRRIDYVFAGLPRRDGLGQILACRVVCDDERDGVFPSDHFGVYAELRSEAE
jgi:endonuclease/exonuclease/phosphatase family metal-dependent hydrolase